MNVLESRETMEVQAIMTKAPTTADPTQAVIEIYHLFKEVGYHHIPVVSGRELVGILSDRDIAKCVTPNIDDEALAQSLPLLQPVSEIMSTELITVDGTTSIDCASILLLENNISCLPVVDDQNQVEGILTWKDILRFFVYHE
ncbi:MAG: acetoin utilization protein AcuB [Candidatus Azotimanducaceae bacterium]|jgi:acetoin utilization protein AcuB